MRKQWALGLIGFAVTASIAWLFVGHFGAVSERLATLPLLLLLALAGLQAVSYLARVVSWDVALRSAGTRLPARHLYGVSGLAFAINLVLPSYVGAAVRVGLLKRCCRDTGVGVGQMAMIDVLALVIEAAILVALIAPLTLIFAPGYWWCPSILLAAVLLTAAVIPSLRRRLGHLSWTRSLAVFQSRRDLVRFTVPLGVVLLIQPLRFWLVLGALGVSVGIVIALLAFVVVSLVAALPIGNSQAGFGGLGVAFSTSQGADVVLAAGAALGATAAIGALAYLAIVAVVLWLPRLGGPGLLSKA